jgi:hypothetical protein
MLKKKIEQNSVILSDTVPPSSSPERVAGEDRSFCFFLLYSFLPRALPKPEAPRLLMMRNRGSRALPATPTGQLTWRRGRAGKPCSPCSPFTYKYCSQQGGDRDAPAPHLPINIALNRAAIGTPPLPIYL